MRKSLISGGVLMVLALSAVPAHAAVTESGTKICTQNQTGVSRSYSTGTTEHYPPDTGYAVFYNGGSWLVKTRAASAGGGGFWFVSTNGNLNDAGTYAYCVNGTP